MQRLRVKICGIRDTQTAILACEMGADSLGFVFHEKSPRNIAPLEVRRITEAMPPFVNKTGVFVEQGEDEILRITETAGLDTIQLHGNGREYDHELVRRLREKTGLTILAALRVEKLDEPLLLSLSDKSVNGWLIDRYDPSAFGGTGKSVELQNLKNEQALKTLRQRVILAGGLNPENVAAVLKSIRPWGIDVSSGLESERGVKDPAKIRAFMKAVKEAERDC